MFSQEVPNDPDGYRYVWHSNHRGRIMLERVRLPEGRDAWLFSRGTLRNLDALVEGHRDKTPDPRYATIGVVIGDDVLTVGKDAKVPPPPGVPKELGSPRKALRTFLESMDELEFDADQVRYPPRLPRPRRDPAGGPSRHRAAAGRQARGDSATAECRPADGRRHLGG